MTFIVPYIFLNIGISSRKFVWGLYWQCASFVSFLCTNNDCFSWITPPFPLNSFKCYFRSSILILINTVLKLWNKQRFCSFVYGYYTYIYYVSPFSGGEEWKIVADQLGFEDAYIRCFDNRFKNPVELILSCSDLRVGKLYDVLVECGFPLLADLL